MMIRRLGMIGAGGMAETVLTALAAGLPTPLESIGLVVKPGKEKVAQALLDRIGDRLAHRRAVHAGVETLLADQPHAVVECAGHSAVRQYGEAVLNGGCDFVVISTGALVDDALHQSLVSVARRRGVQLVLAAGAVGGIDAIGAARLSGLRSVTYTGRKPPSAWRGSAAERLLDLNSLSAPAIFFDGTARQAAADYPQNANVAATVAIAGLGFDATTVRLIADPAATCNVHEISVRAQCGDFDMTFKGRPSPFNPKTSLTAGFSVARGILNRSGALVI